MVKYLRLTIVITTGSLLASCAQQTTRVGSRPVSHRLHRVRTTAYSRGENGGRQNALDARLSSRHVMSAASDWSRFPLGTHFRIVGTNEEYVIDDYGTALVGTSTIDLYKRSRLAMKRWGVRHVDIDILEWGSEEQSLKVLDPASQTSDGAQNDRGPPEKNDRVDRSQFRLKGLRVGSIGRMKILVVGGAGYIGSVCS